MNQKHEDVSPMPPEEAIAVLMEFYDTASDGVYIAHYRSLRDVLGAAIKLSKSLLAANEALVMEVRAAREELAKCRAQLEQLLS